MTKLNILRLILLTLVIATTMVGVSKINYKHNKTSTVIVDQLINGDFEDFKPDVEG